MDPTDPLSREAIRIYRRYQTEVVEALKLCPWAERAREDGHVEEVVLGGPEPNLGAALDAISSLDAKREIEIGLLLFPRARVSRSAFDEFVATLTRADSEQRPIGTTPFAMAAFHPSAEPDLRTPERLIPFLRRTPDPTIQLVRVTSLERVREGRNEGTEFVDPSAIASFDFASRDKLSLRERISRGNQKTVERVGVNEIERRLADIRADRDASYARWEGPVAAGPAKP